MEKIGKNGEEKYMEQSIGEQVKHPLEEVYFEEMEKIVKLFKK